MSIDRGTRVTISDLARRLEISKASVSYALNGRPGVSEKTRRRVLELADTLGFQASSAAVAPSLDERASTRSAPSSTGMRWVRRSRDSWMRCSRRRRRR